MAQPRNILIIRPSALGDVCRTVPVLSSLKRAYPEARIDWLVQDSFVDAIWHHPGLTEAIPFARKEMGQGLKQARGGGLFALIGKLRQSKYDLVLDCQGLARSGFFAWMSGARQRVGYSDARELAWIWMNHRVKAPASMHTVDRMLALVNALADPVADMRLYTGPQERAWAERQARLWSGGRYIVLAPTSRWAAKRWPAERFAAVAEAVVGGAAVAVVGAESERDQIRPLMELAVRERRVIDLVGQTSVGQLMALIQGAALVIANDSAALHMAVGFDRPSIGLFGPTRLEFVGPYQKHGPRSKAVVIQHVKPGDAMDHKDERGRELMDRITVEEVSAAAEAALGSMVRLAEGG